MRQTPFVYRFGAFELDPASRRLVSGAERIRLTEPQISTLLQLVSEAPEIVDLNRLAQEGWGGSTSDNNIRQAISRLRKALSDADPACPAGAPQGRRRAFVQTVPNQGYRFVAPVERRETDEPIADLGVDDELLEGFIQGRRDLATLNRDAIPNARRRFERFLENNPNNARAHACLSHACALIFEATRTDTTSDVETLAAALHHGRRATTLEPALADAWSALGFALALSGDNKAATVAAWKAVTLRGGTFRDWVRLAYVSWGEDRLETAGQALQLCPELALACWLQATVYVARGAFEPALALLNTGCVAQDRQRTGPVDYPAVGLHLLRGLVYAALGHLDDAEQEFAAELAAPDRGQLYSRECAANTWYARGAVCVRRGQIREATAAFERALEIEPGHLYSLAALGRPIPTLSPDDPRSINAGIARAIALARAGRHADAAEAFRAAVMTSSVRHAGWILPVEPILHPSARPEIWSDLLAIIRDRATGHA